MFSLNIIARTKIYFMKKYLALFAVVPAFALFTYLSTPQNVTSSQAAYFTVTYTDTQYYFPTMRPFPTVSFQWPSYNYTPAPTIAPTKTPTPKPTTTSTPAPSNSLTDQVITLVNNERSKVGLSSLSNNSALTTAAQNYAQYMANSNFFSHTGLDGSSFDQRVTKAGYTNYHWLGENIAAGQRTASEVMQGWMNSEGHRKNILNSNAKEIGVGYATNNNSTYKTYWVQEFGAR
jgi:uncharacterized protein YkwD